MAVQHLVELIELPLDDQFFGVLAKLLLPRALQRVPVGRDLSSSNAFSDAQPSVIVNDSREPIRNVW